MREIKFRGKRISNSEWVYGYYFESFTGTSYILGMYDHLLEMAEHYEVDTKTVGQFTGLLDKNGKEIYDGDLFDDEDDGYLVVVYSEKESAFMLNQYNYRMWHNEGGGEEYGNFELLDSESMTSWNIENMEIIGNKWEHPHLLEVS